MVAETRKKAKMSAGPCPAGDEAHMSQMSQMSHMMVAGAGLVSGGCSAQGTCHPVMSHVWSEYQTTLNELVETETMSSERLALHRSSSRAMRWSGLSTDGWSRPRW